jgi:SagB-type dehydrogenase family enzyme
LYILNLNISGLENGIYYYNAHAKCLQLLTHLNEQEKQNILRDGFRTDGRNDIDFGNASAIIFFGAFLSRVTFKYQDRGLRFAFFEIGCILQNLYLNAAALNIGCCANGGFIDDYICNLLDFKDRSQTVLLTAIIGKIK